MSSCLPFCRLGALFNVHGKFLEKWAIPVPSKLIRMSSTTDNSSELPNKRKLYRCGTNYKTLNDIPTWREYTDRNVQRHSEVSNVSANGTNPVDLATKVSCFEGDITCLEIGAIVNAANNSLRGGGGVDGAIHRAAGKELLAECIQLRGCATGEAKITKGYNLPSKYVIHTVGPTDKCPVALKNCYKRSFDLVKQHEIKSVAFPCIATGIYGFPNDKAAEIAITTTVEFLKKNPEMERVIFCLFTDTDKVIYKKLLSQYFP